MDVREPRFSRMLFDGWDTDPCRERRLMEPDGVKGLVVELETK